MTRRKTRVVWSLLGICLLIGGAASLVIWLGPVDRAARPLIRELSAVADILALLFWLLVFAIHWTGRDDSKGE